MNDWADLDRALNALASSGNAEVREDGQWLAELTGLGYELRAEGNPPLVHRRTQPHPPHSSLTANSAPKLVEVVRQLMLHRSPLASDVKHPLYRAAPERWLESLVLEAPDRLDAQLDPQ